MTESAAIFDFLAAQIADVETQWSLGTFGAIAEFMRDAGEPVDFRRDDGRSPRSPRAAASASRRRPTCGCSPSRPPRAKAGAHRVALCLPDERLRHEPARAC